MKISTCKPYSIKVYIAGPIEIAKQYLRKYSLQGFCCTIEPTLYIYTGAEEIGYVVGIENYPRFPESNEKLREIAFEICSGLIEETHQQSGMIVTNDESIMLSRRDSLPLKNN